MAVLQTLNNKLKYISFTHYVLTVPASYAYITENYFTVRGKLYLRDAKALDRGNHLVPQIRHLLEHCFCLGKYKMLSAGKHLRWLGYKHKFRAKFVCMTAKGMRAVFMGQAGRLGKAEMQSRGAQCWEV